MTHADIANKPDRIISLCGKTIGDFVWQDRSLIELDGKLSAEIDCERCKTTAQFLGRGHSLSDARQIAKRQAV